MSKYDTSQAHALGELLYKLGIKSAKNLAWEHAVFDGMQKVLQSFGKPDMLYMDPHTHEQFKKTFSK